MSTSNESESAHSGATKHPVRIVCCVANDKGGGGKSHVSANTFEYLDALNPSAWTLVEVEQKPTYTQTLYDWPQTARLLTLALMEIDPASDRTLPSLRPLDELWSLLPRDGDNTTDCRVLIDFGASAFQSFLLWGIQHRGFEPFIEHSMRFVFIIPVYGSEIESQRFFNNYTPKLRELGSVVLLRNLVQGDRFDVLDAQLASEVPNLRMLYTGKPLTEELVQGEKRLTYRRLEKLPSASRRAHLDAKGCATDFEQQLASISSLLT